MKRNFEIKRSTVAKGLLLFIGVMVLFALPVLLFGVGAIALAAGGVGVVGTVDTATVIANVPTLDLEDISQDICKILPSNFPLDTILRQIRKTDKIGSQFKRYYSVGGKPFTDTPAAAAQGTGDGSSVANAAITYTYASGNGLPEFYINVNNPNTWKKHDTFILQNINVNSGYVVSATVTVPIDIVLYVIDKSGTTLRVKPINGIKGLAGNAAIFCMPNFTNTTTLFRLGNAMEEKALQTDAWSMLPQPDEQLCQNYMVQLEESTFQKLTRQEVEWGINDFEDQSLYDLRAMIEMSQLRSRMATVYNPVDNNNRYTTGGILNTLLDAGRLGSWTKASGVTATNYLDWAEAAFVGNNGSDTKVLLAGSGLIKSLHKVDTISKQVDGRSPVVEWGLTFSQITTFFGVIKVIHHPLFSLDTTGWAYNGVILDLAYVQKHNFIPMHTQTLDLKSSGIRNVDARVIQECSCVTITNPKCHLVIKGV